MAANDSKAEREARLAAALRANLRRRKAPLPVVPDPSPGDAADPDQRPVA